MALPLMSGILLNVPSRVEVDSEWGGRIGIKDGGAVVLAGV